jgi:prepilin-type N-terminal cleavage/methylation domain-containing protein
MVRFLVWSVMQTMRHLAHSTAAIGSARRRGFTMIELMLVLVIMSIVAVLGMDAIADFEASQRADRAARESLAFFRFARNLAMTTGKKAKVTVSTTSRTVSIYWQSNGTTYDATPYATGMTGSGTAVLNLTTARELVGTAVALNPTTTTSFEYSALGTCAQTGTVKFNFGGRSKTLSIVNVGDPQLQ